MPCPSPPPPAAASTACGNDSCGALAVARVVMATEEKLVAAPRVALPPLVTVHWASVTAPPTVTEEDSVTLTAAAGWFQSAGTARVGQMVGMRERAGAAADVSVIGYVVVLTCRARSMRNGPSVDPAVCAYSRLPPGVSIIFDAPYTDVSAARSPSSPSGPVVTLAPGGDVAMTVMSGGDAVRFSSRRL